MAQSKFWILGASLILAAGIALAAHAILAPSTGGDFTSVNTVNDKKNAPRTDLKKHLSPMQYHVTQENGTEPAFQNAYWNEHREGIYVDVVSGEVLFSSKDKFDSGCGWPSFSKPVNPGGIAEKRDASHGMLRTEVRAKGSNSHLGHVFDDGPRDKGGLRYCINSAALRFIPVADLEKEGYGSFLPLFAKLATKSSDEKNSDQTELATLAGGCFWGMEDLLRKQPGVLRTEVGYTGGRVANATYRNHEGHAEAVRIEFDPSKTSFETLLNFFFRMHDPTTLNRQGNDIGSSYRSAIFFHSEEQRRVAEKVKAEVGASGKWSRPIVTEIVKAGLWWRAEEEHQDYLVKHPGGYTCHWVRD